MYFDGAAKIVGAGVGIIFFLIFIILGLQITLNFGITKLDVFGDSELVVRQLTTEYEVRRPSLRRYYDVAQGLLEQLFQVSVGHVPRAENTIADALANLATALAVAGGQAVVVKVEQRSRIPDSYEEETVKPIECATCMGLMGTLSTPLRSRSQGCR